MQLKAYHLLSVLCLRRYRSVTALGIARPSIPSTSFSIFSFLLVSFVWILKQGFVSLVYRGAGSRV